MSLNGLDAPQVQDAYNVTVNEAGGWFLLKYVSRDEVELLDRGKGGVAEARASIIKYPDLSPLYGLIMFRRKKVIIKYVPEGTSRLLQARTTVHLQDVLEKYAPYETMVDITAAEALNDTALAAAFPLHTATPSIMANKLDEITEDAEEPMPPKQQVDSLPPPSLPGRKPSTERKSSAERWPSRRSQAIATALNVDLAKAPSLSQKSSVSRILVREESGHQSFTPLDTPATSEYAPSETDVQDTESIMSGKSGGESIRSKSASGPPLTENGEIDFDKYYADMFKAKVRLGPRPVVISDKGRRKANVPSQSGRPTSSLPPGIQTTGHQNKQASSDSLHSPLSPLSLLPSFPRPPPTPTDAFLYPPRPGSQGSTRSIPQSISSVKTSKSTMTPEKMRLMKAMELRKKQMRRSTPNEKTAMPALPENTPTMPTIDDSIQLAAESDDSGSHKADSGIQIIYEKVAEIKGAASEEKGADLPVKHELADDGTKSASNSSAQAPVLGPDFPKTQGLLFADNLSSSQKPETKGGLPRSPALSSLLENVKIAPFASIDQPEYQPQDERMSQTLSEEDFQLDTVHPDKRSTMVQKKRRGLIEPLTINVDDTSAQGHDSDASDDDDDLMEELQSATVQEAMPMLMHRSPASPFFPPRRPSARSAQSAHSIISAVSGASIASVINTQEPSRRSSDNDKESTQRSSYDDKELTNNMTSHKDSPINTSSNDAELSIITTLNSRGKAQTPELLSPISPLSSRDQGETQGRSLSISSTWTADSEHSDSLIATRSRQVSSGISKRIQALAEKSARDSSPSSVASSELQKPEKKATARLSVWPSPSATYTAQPNISTNRESISVTARIVRQPAARAGSPELHHSPILINHTRPTPTVEFPPMAPRLTVDPVREPEDPTLTDSRQQSLSPTFSFSSAETGNGDRRKSFDRKSISSRYRSNYDSPKKTISREMSAASLASNDSDKSSRTSRFFRRISHIGGNKRRSISLAPMTSLSEPSEQASVAESIHRPETRTGCSPDDLPPAIVIGDLNVQFPETLLWKRRWVEIDQSGTLIFTAARPSTSGGKNRGGRGFVTKFGLVELKRPYIPDVDRQEMPHSVLFDLVDGATLSCSSEDSMAQRQLLSLLSTYHQAWTSDA